MSERHASPAQVNARREALCARVARLQADLARASAPWGRPPTLLAVTKQQPAEVINLLEAASITQIGENRVQDWREKSADLLPSFALHWLGRLQTNKVKYIIEQVCLIHSLDRPALAEEIGRCAQGVGRRIPVLVQVNIAGEAQKAGLPPDEVERFLRAYAAHPGLEISGLMAIMPQADDPETLRPYFRALRAMFDDLQGKAVPGVAMRHLSMGMSADCLVAAQEGATIVRVGTALFGAGAGHIPSLQEEKA